MTKETNATVNAACNGSGSPSHSKTPSIASSTATDSTNTIVTLKDRLRSITDEDIIQKNLKELMEKKNREERKANGRLVAVILASLVIFLAVYHAWIRKSGILAGVLVPAVIMVSFGGWVVILAKRDKARRAMFERYLEEVAQKNKQELEAKKLKPHKKANERKASNETLLEYVNEINKEKNQNMSVELAKTCTVSRSKDHRKHRKHRNIDGILELTSSSTSSASSRNYAHKDLRIKRPSIRQKLFRQTGLYHMTAASSPAAGGNTTQSLVQAVINTTPLQPLGVVRPADVAVTAQMLPDDTKRKRLQRLDALHVPTMVRMGSAP